jgi:hypothetical protein
MCCSRTTVVVFVAFNNRSASRDYLVAKIGVTSFQGMNSHEMHRSLVVLAVLQPLETSNNREHDYTHSLHCPPHTTVCHNNLYTRN